MIRFLYIIFHLNVITKWFLVIFIIGYFQRIKYFYVNLNFVQIHYEKDYKLTLMVRKLINILLCYLILKFTLITLKFKNNFFLNFSIIVGDFNRIFYSFCWNRFYLIFSCAKAVLINNNANV